MKCKTITKILSAAMIMFVLLAILLSQIQVSDFITSLVNIHPIYLVVGFVLYIGSYVLRALRFYILLDREVAIKELFNIVCIHNMVNNILPARTGELSYVYLVNNKYNRPVGDAIASLFAARLFDLIALLVLFSISSLMLQDLHEMTTTVIRAIIFLNAFIVSVLLTTWMYFDEDYLNRIENRFYKLNLGKNKVVAYLLKLGYETVSSFEKIRSFDRIIVMDLMIISIGIWLSIYYSAYIILRGMDVSLDFAQIIFATAFSLFTTVLPIQGIGGFGTFEGGWTVGFISVGLTKEAAIISGFTYHLIIMLYFLILGLIGLVTLNLKE